MILRRSHQLREEDRPARLEVIPHDAGPLFIRVVDDLAGRTPQSNLIARVELVVLPVAGVCCHGLGVLEPATQQEVRRAGEQRVEVVEQLEQLVRDVPFEEKRNL